jgi:hypothetical protein
MHTNSIIAVSGALFALAAAVPMQQHQHHKRDYFWVTKIEEVIVTVPVTETVWIAAGAATPTSSAVQYHAPPPAQTSAAAAAPVQNNKPYVPPSPSSAEVVAAPVTTSQQVAPAPQPTTSAYVPPPAPQPTTAAPAVAPAPTTSAAPAPAPATSSVYVAPQAAPSAASSSGGSGAGGMAAPGTSYTGDATYTDFSIGLGSCGELSSNSENVVAISHLIFDSFGVANPNNNPTCNKMINIKGLDGQTYQAKVTDRCPVCAMGSIDLPQQLFNKVTNNGDGRVHNIEWSWA